MKKYLGLILLTVSLGLAGCRVGTSEKTTDSSGAVVGGNPSTNSTGKSLFSQWFGGTNESTLDLRHYKLGQTQTIQFDFDNGAGCSCTAVASGSGQLVQVSGCTMSSGTGSTQQYCANLDGAYTIDQNGSLLAVCDSNGACSQLR